MIIWPNIQLRGQFMPCEEGILEAINFNFAVLDALTQLAAIGFVDEPPSSPSLGDIYILTDDTNAYTNSASAIIVWDGDDWFYITAREGFLAYVTGQGFFWYNGVDWVNFLPAADIQIDIPNNQLTAYGTGLILDSTKYVSYTIRFSGFRTNSPINLRSIVIFWCVFKSGVGWIVERDQRPDNLGVSGEVDAITEEFSIKTTDLAGGSYSGKGTLKILDRSSVEV